uniref:DUF1947 domain-containing protein n=1 Tax=Fervidicoccus fontis TaxID=683846 RepID=A0A7J3ZN08_9CREN
MRRFFLSKRERKKLLQELESTYNITLHASTIEVIVEGNCTLYLVDGTPAFILVENVLIPHLKYLIKKGHCFLPKVVVNRGAVLPISRGADVMAPGIVGFEGEFYKYGIVVVVDEKVKAPIAVGRALYSLNEISKMKRGRVIENVHHYQDRYWILSERL